MFYRTTADHLSWTLATAGVLAILFGLAALIWPGLTLIILIALFGAYAIIDGIVALVAMLRAIGEHTTWWTHLARAVFSIAAGIVVFAWPGITTIALLYVIAFWALTIGVAEIVGAFATGQFLWAIAGTISVLFGIVLLANPLEGALALVTVIGVFAIIRGILLLVAAVRLPHAPAAGLGPVTR